MEKLDKPCSTEFVYDRESFKAGFELDLESAQSFALIQSPYLDIKVIKPFVRALRRALARGVRICLFVRQPKYWHRKQSWDPARAEEMEELQRVIAMLEAIGVHVNLRTAVHEKLAVFDGLYFWDGSLNIFSYGASSERMTRFTNSAKALNAVRKHRLDACLQCSKSGCKDGIEVFSPNTQSGTLLQRVRKRRKVSQEQLAATSSASRATISRVESGKQNMNLSKFSEICSALNYSLVLGPDYAVPAIERLIPLLPEPD